MCFQKTRLRHISMCLCYFARLGVLTSRAVSIPPSTSRKHMMNSTIIQGLIKLVHHIFRVIPTYTLLTDVDRLGQRNGPRLYPLEELTTHKPDLTWRKLPRYICEWFDSLLQSTIVHSTFVLLHCE